MIGLAIDGVAAVTEGLTSLGDEIGDVTRRQVAASAQALRQRIADGPLDGGVLQRRSGRLAASLTVDMAEGDTGASATIGDTAPYARFQQLGFDGSESIRQTLRTIRQAFGRPIPARAVVVRAHQRNVHYPAHPFLEMDDDAMAASFADVLQRSVR